MTLLACIFLILTSNNIYTFGIEKDENNFGPYDVIWTRYELCRGPKLRNSTNFGLVIKKQNIDYFGTVDLDVLFQTSLDEVKVWVYKLKGESRSLLWVYKLVDICKHFAFAEIIKNELNAHNCVIEKGFYNRTLNFTEMTKKLLGSSFFYGNYSIKAAATSKKANFLCFLLNMTILKN